LATDPAGKLDEGERSIVRPRHDLAFDDCAVRQIRRDGSDLGETSGDELSAAGPEIRLVAPANELGANAVPLPLDLPVARVAECLQLFFHGVGEIERIWLGDIGIGRLHGDERVPRLGASLPRAAETMRDHAFRYSAGARQSPDDERLRHADAKAAGN